MGHQQSQEGVPQYIPRPPYSGHSSGTHHANANSQWGQHHRPNANVSGGGNSSTAGNGGTGGLDTGLRTDTGIGSDASHIQQDIHSRQPQDDEEYPETFSVATTTSPKDFLANVGIGVSGNGGPGAVSNVATSGGGGSGRIDTGGSITSGVTPGNGMNTVPHAPVGSASLPLADRIRALREQVNQGPTSSGGTGSTATTESTLTTISPDGHETRGGHIGDGHGVTHASGSAGNAIVNPTVNTTTPHTMTPGLTGLGNPSNVTSANNGAGDGHGRDLPDQTQSRLLPSQTHGPTPPHLQPTQGHIQLSHTQGHILQTQQATDVSQQPQLTSADPTALELVPTLFKWTHGTTTGRVYLAGSFNEWRGKAPMEPTGDGEYELVVDLPPGHYLYRYVVDDAWRVDPNAPIISHYGQEHVVNVIEVRRPVFGAYQATLKRGAESDDEDDGNQGTRTGDDSTGNGAYSTEFAFPSTSYGFLIPPMDAYSKEPPKVPSQLVSKTILNESMGDPTELPQPLHVTINHLAVWTNLPGSSSASISETKGPSSNPVADAAAASLAKVLAAASAATNVTAITERFQTGPHVAAESRFVTTVYYAPKHGSSGLVPPASTYTEASSYDQA